MQNATAWLIAELCKTAALADSYTRTAIMERVDKLIAVYAKERETEQ